jgi:hypothetical protein
MSIQCAPFLPRPEEAQTVPGSAEKIETDAREGKVIEMFAAARRGGGKGYFFWGLPFLPRP